MAPIAGERLLGNLDDMTKYFRDAFDLLIEDYKCYREGLLAQGFWALQIHRFGYARNRFRSRIIRVPWAIVHMLLSKLSQVLFGIYIGPKVKLGRRCVIEHFGCIIIHSNVVIGDDVVIRQGVTIGNRSLDAPQDVPTIGNRVNIGAGAKILGRVIIGDDVNIGANAVVLKDVPSDSTAVGVPARVLQRRNNPIPD